MYLVISIIVKVSMDGHGIDCIDDDVIERCETRDKAVAQLNSHVKETYEKGYFNKLIEWDEEDGYAMLYNGGTTYRKYFIRKV